MADGQYVYHKGCCRNHRVYISVLVFILLVHLYLSEGSIQSVILKFYSRRCASMLQQDIKISASSVQEFFCLE